MKINGLIGRVGRLINKLDKYIFSFLTPDSKVALWMLRGKMVFAKKLFGIDYQDFFRCRCDQSSFYQMSKIVPFSEQEKLWLEVNSADSRAILFDKYKAYLHFKGYYQRDVVFVNSKKSEDAFVMFCQNHPRFIIKPLACCCGSGIQIINTDEDAFQVQRFLDSNPDGFVAEELINQNIVLSRLHPESVNTLRINTVNYGTSVEIKWPCLRIGRGTSVVDNAGAGGVFGSIDIATGVITAVSDEFHHTFSKHPDTGIPLIGFQMPKWKEACEMAKELAGLIPDCHFVAWDLALTDKGWVMVEGNHRPLIIYQIATGKGIRKEFNRMKRLLLKI